MTHHPPTDDGISAYEPDWSRERPLRWYDPPRRFLAALRAAQRHAQHPIRRAFAMLRYRVWSIITQIDIPVEAEVAGGLLMPHPNGIVVHASVSIGPNCLLMQQVTLGIGRRNDGAPRLGGHVDVSAGAKLIGNISIGDHALIGANAVVTHDVPPYAIVAGVPARQIGSREKGT
jgi:serine O-acetyltransferase